MKNLQNDLHIYCKNVTKQKYRHLSDDFKKE